MQELTSHPGDFFCWCSVYVVPQLVKMAEEGVQLALLWSVLHEQAAASQEHIPQVPLHCRKGPHPQEVATAVLLCRQGRSRRGWGTLYTQCKVNNINITKALLIWLAQTVIPTMSHKSIWGHCVPTVWSRPVASQSHSQLAIVSFRTL